MMTKEYIELRSELSDTQARLEMTIHELRVLQQTKDKPAERKAREYWIIDRGEKYPIYTFYLRAHADNWATSGMIPFLAREVLPE